MQLLGGQTYILMQEMIVTYSKLHLGRLVTLHALFGGHSIVAREHLDKCMALVCIDDAGLD